MTHFITDLYAGVVTMTFDLSTSNSQLELRVTLGTCSPNVNIGWDHVWLRPSLRPNFGLSQTWPHPFNGLLFSSYQTRSADWWTDGVPIHHYWHNPTYFRDVL